MELEEGELTNLKEGPSDSNQDFQNVQGEMETELNITKSGEAVMSSVSNGTTVTSKSTSSHKNTVMDLRKREEHQKKSKELSSTTRKPISSVTSHTKAVQSSYGVKNHASVSQTSAGSNEMDLQASILGRSLQTGGILSSITVPMRLDALAYLLNHAVMSPYNVMPQGPCFPNQCSIAACRNANTSPYSHIPLTYCSCHGGTPSAVDYHSVPIYLTQQHNSTNAIYPNHASINTGYHPAPINSVQGQNYSHADQHVANREMAVHSDRRLEQMNSSPSTISTKKWDDTSRPMQTFDEASYTERRNSSFNQARCSFTRNDFRSTSLHGSSGNWKSSQNDGCEWQDRSFGRPTGKFNDDSGSNYRRGGAGDHYKGSGFDRGRSFGSDFRSRKRNEEENSCSSGQDSFSAPKQVRRSGIAEGSWQQRRGQPGSTKQEQYERLGENCRSKMIESPDKGKKSIFAGKRIASVEDWDAEYDTKQSKSGGQEEKSSILQHAKYQNRSIHEEWETEYFEEKDSKQEGSLQLQHAEEETIDVGKEDIDESAKKCQSSLGSITCVQSSISSEVDNIFKIMEKDAACAATVSVSGEKAHTVELPAISGAVDSNIDHQKPIMETSERDNHRPSAETYEQSVNDAMKTANEHGYIEDTNKGHDEGGPVMQNVSGPVALIMPSEKYESMIFFEVVESNEPTVGENVVESISLAEHKDLANILD